MSENSYYVWVIGLTDTDIRERIEYLETIGPLNHHDTVTKLVLTSQELLREMKRN